MSEENTRKIMKAIEPAVVGEPPIDVADALCTMLGIFLAHVLEEKPEAEKAGAVDLSLEMFEVIIRDAYKASASVRLTS